MIAAGVTAGLVVLGLLLGLIWHRLAPGVLSVWLRDGTTAPLPTESNHNFDSVALFVLMGWGAGLVTGIALWQWRSQRGPVLLVGGAAVSLLSAWIAYRTGFWLISGAVTPGPVGTLVAVPPTLGSAIVIVAQPLGTTLAYTFAALFSRDEHLGRPARVRAAPAELSCGTASR